MKLHQLSEVSEESTAIPHVVHKNAIPLVLGELPLCVSFALLSGYAVIASQIVDSSLSCLLLCRTHLITDPTHEEEQVANASVTVRTGVCDIR